MRGVRGTEVRGTVGKEDPTALSPAALREAGWPAGSRNRETAVGGVHSPSRSSALDSVWFPG